MEDNGKAKRKSFRIRISVKRVRPKPHYPHWMMAEFQREQKIWESECTAREGESTARESECTARESETSSWRERRTYE